MDVQPTLPDGPAARTGDDLHDTRGAVARHPAPGPGLPPPHPPIPPIPAAPALLGPRSALIFLLGALVAIGAGALLHLGQQDATAAVLGACGAFGGAVLFFHSIIGT
ncbi:hypothetical protein [Streptomyces marincola]|uniref:hypothetical protein n=1 Tax=Streptomyces marincola TaxID=2878388 RepID=UPI001CF37D93|nr:hypothetical protein [Streptomyces marincola]UCM89782.1 hypothetical protein LC193_18505 [Streptomyces marincola]